MVFSGLFQDRFIDQVQVVGYLHDQMAVEDQSSGGALDPLVVARANLNLESLGLINIASGATYMYS